jgi:hypothetical protein
MPPAMRQKTWSGAGAFAFSEPERAGVPRVQNGEHPDEVEVNRLAEHANSKHVTYELKGRSRREPMTARCHTCRSRHRARIERLLLQGQPPTAIVREHLPKNAGLKPANIAEHYRRGHVAAEDEIARRILDEQAEARAARIDEDATIVITERRLAESILEAAWERMRSGELTPTMPEAIAAARVLAKRDPVVLEERSWRNAANESQSAILRLLDVFYDLVDDDQWNAMGHALNGDDYLVPFVAHCERKPRRARTQRRH